MKTRVLAVSLITLATILGLVLAGPIPQDRAYHDFADQRSLLGVPHFLNVISNLPFLLAGTAGLIFVLGKRSMTDGSFVDRVERVPYIWFFLGVTLTSFGSAYYHLSPGNDRLVLDRLPMSIAFMALLASVVAERVNLSAALVLLAPLMLLGATSVVYWYVGEQSGVGDLRPYVLVQFNSLLAVALAAMLLSSRYTRSCDILVAAGVYTLAKLFEILDSFVFGMGEIVSGHTLKHVFAAGAAYLVVRMLKRRQPAPQTDYPPVRPLERRASTGSRTCACRTIRY